MLKIVTNQIPTIHTYKPYTQETRDQKDQSHNEHYIICACVVNSIRGFAWIHADAEMLK